MELQQRLLAQVAGRTGVRGGFIDGYIRWACGQTDAPPSGHILAALISVASVVGTRSRVRIGTHHVSPNIFGMMIGASGRVRKTWSQSMAQRMLQGVCPERVGLSSGSYEAMVDELKERPLCTIFEEEFSTVLAGGSSGGPIPRLKTGLTKLYDGGRTSNRTRKGGSVSVEGYRLNLMAAISPSYLSEYTNPEDYTGGFLSRWLMVYGERPAGQFLGLFDSVPDPDEEERLRTMLGQILTHCPVGRFDMAPEALEEFRAWERGIEAQSIVVQEKTQGYLSRAGSLAVRLAGLIAMDRMVVVEGHTEDQGIDFEADKRTWYIRPADFEIARNIVNAHLMDVQRIVSTIEHGKDAKTKGRVLEAVPTDWVPLAFITQRSGMTLKTIRDPLDTLVAEGQVAKSERPGSGLLFKRLPPTTTEAHVEDTPSIPLPILPLGIQTELPIPLGVGGGASPAAEDHTAEYGVAPPPLDEVE